MKKVLTALLAVSLLTGGYLGVAHLSGGAFWTLAGLAAALPDKARPWAAGTAAALALALPAMQLATHAGRWSLAGFDAAEAVGTQTLKIQSIFCLKALDLTPSRTTSRWLLASTVAKSASTVLRAVASPLYSALQYPGSGPTQ